MSYEVELRKWASELRDSEIDDVLEFLHDSKLLNDAGEKMAKRFWKKYIKEKPSDFEKLAERKIKSIKKDG